MSGATVTDFIGYWESEGAAYVKHGDYDWMAAQVPGRRILEIGCGVGFSTRALAARGLTVLVIDALAECIDATRDRVAGLDVAFMTADLAALSEVQRAELAAFAPDTVVCWVMGAPAETTGATGSDAGKAVIAYRERIHRLVAQLATDLPSVKALHYVDRTVIPWQAKDIGRDTLVGYHAGKTLLDLPFKAERRNALYRKLESAPDGAPFRKSHPSLKGAVPTLASLLAERNN